MPQSYFSLTEAATRKDVHYQTVRRAIARGHLKAMKVGGGADGRQRQGAGRKPGRAAAAGVS